MKHSRIITARAVGVLTGLIVFLLSVLFVASYHNFLFVLMMILGILLVGLGSIMIGIGVHSLILGRNPLKVIDRVLARLFTISTLPL